MISHAMDRDDHLFPMPLVMAPHSSHYDNAITAAPNSGRPRVSTRDGSALAAIGRVSALFCEHDSSDASGAQLRVCWGGVHGQSLQRASGSESHHVPHSHCEVVAATARGFLTTPYGHAARTRSTPRLAVWNSFNARAHSGHLPLGRLLP